MRRKREFIARASAAAGITRMFESVPKQRLLMILNYHRIGNARETPYDSGAFSCTADQFDWQIGYLKRHYRVATFEECLASAFDGDGPSEPSVLITLDDGYIDNYRTAFPILRRHAVQGVFFLPTAFVGTGSLPWWDVIAYVVKHSKRDKICLEYPEPRTFDLAKLGVEKTITHILKLYTQPSMKDHNRFVETLENACESALPPINSERCFLSWDEARQMKQAGMAFGSHTHTHEILGRMPIDRQREEALVSREILRYELRQDIDTMAYPVGALHTFSQTTVRALKEAGYRAAFSFYGGFNRPGAMRPFDICRLGIGGLSRSRFRLRTSLGTLTGRYWF